MCRWVVEAVNGQIKCDFKFFRQNYNHKSMLHMMSEFKIAAALVNKIAAKFSNSDLAEPIVALVNERRNLNNNLYDIVDIWNLNRQTAIFTNKK